MALKRSLERLRRKISRQIGPARKVIVLSAADPVTGECFYRLRLMPKGRRGFTVTEEVLKGDGPREPVPSESQ